MITNQRVAHKWLIRPHKGVEKQLSELPARDRQAVFDSIAELLRAENPCSVDGVKKLLDKKFKGVYRQRQGNYRVLFSIESGEVVHLKFEYKGKLHVLAVLCRDEGTYR